MRNGRAWALAALAALGVAASCSNEGAAGNPGNFATSGEALSAADVDQILVNAVQAATAANVPAAIAITDREGEVLAVFVTAARDVNNDGVLETPGEANVQTAIAKAATAAAFQSEGEAFTTRTAYYIVQGHYPPNVKNTAAGPLFGVQDSSLPSSDAHPFAFDAAGNACGTGVSGLYGGVPLYKNGTPVGGIGVDSVGALVSLSTPTDARLSPTRITPLQNDADEAIARAGARGREAPLVIRATNVFVEGIGFPFHGQGGAAPGGGVAASASAIPASVGAIDARFPVRASPLAPETRNGSTFGVRASHRYLGRVVARSAPAFSGSFTNVDRPAAVTLDSSTLTFRNVPVLPLAQATFGGTIGDHRLPIVASIEPPPAEGGLTAGEVSQVIENAAFNAASSVAGIRLPRGSSVTVHVAVVDVRGNVLGVFRMGDGTLFSYDVAVQKARTAAFFSTDGSGGLPALALTPRAIGFLAQPFFPPGIQGTEPGPLVRLRTLVNRAKVELETPPSLTLLNPPARLPSDGTTDENPLVGGFQTANDFGAPPAELAQVRALLGGGGFPLLMDRPELNFVSPGIQNGIQTFPGGVPLYRNGRLVGAVGVSGDGVDEDDAAAFAGGAGFPPPRGARCDEQSDQAIMTVLSAKVATIVNAVLAHPDPRIRNVYGPIAQAERAFIDGRLARGLQNVRIPYVKLPRNPGDR